ncbi:uncharacterized protein LOC132723575 [Ruditapes philippinarum]|uniref:uncharacterized protein LOC132723575 n=1 Tax=Ruditapes philippinarum TaxID=129788 RepID=UPI00295B5CAB|nr:uncharacterized protein LOC132723575 [Ruditapes philippinarum]
MDVWHEMFSLQENEYLKVNVSIYKCEIYERSAKYKEATQNSFQHESMTQTDTSKPPLLKNVLGENLFSSLQGLLGLNKNEGDSSSIASETADPCYVIESVEVQVSVAEICLWALLLFVTTLLIIFAIVLVRKCVSVIKCRLKIRREKKVKEKVKDIVTEVNKEVVKEKERDDSDAEVTNLVDDNDDHDVNKEIEKTKSKGVYLSYQSRVFNDAAVGSSNLITFLDHTTDKLFKKLDKLLLRGLADGQSLSQTCPATPRLARRNFNRRPRIGSSPMLQSLTDAATDDNSESKESAEQERAWQEYKTFSESLQWKFPFVNVTDSSSLNRPSQKLLAYFHRVCPIPRNMWKTSCLVTDYVLFLISQELDTIESKAGYRFIQFVGEGSCRNGTKVARPNHVDILMVVQPPVVPDLVFGNSENGIPPGMVAVSVNSTKYSAYDKKIVSNLEIDGSYKPCLSAKDFSQASEWLIEESLHSLYTKSRSAMDRLPFQVKGAPTATLTLNIKTRALVGFGDTDIKVQITPVLPLPMNGWYQMPMLYATPTDASYEYKQRSDRKQPVNPDLLWQIRTSEFETVFSLGINSMMRHAKVNSCHVVCLMVLKSLLTGCSKNNLLDRGVLPSNHISTVLNFLLLESAPSQWTFEKLGDRFSDAIHFLRSAYNCNRLPHFFVNNPHLISKMPSVAENKMLAQTRQKNLLADIKSENLEKRLEYLETCLRETGLADCVKEEFSNDMWEFEFFLFN